jgi:hypothetical protein
MSVLERMRRLKWTIGIFPLIPRRDGRQHVPMLDDFAAFDANQIVECSKSRREITFRQDKHKVALGHETTRGQVQCQSARKFDPRSASNFDPLVRRARAIALVPSELVGIAEAARARLVG